MDEVGQTLEDQGVAGFHTSFAHVLAALENKAAGQARERPFVRTDETS
jgi:hypothetical protein